MKDRFSSINCKTVGEINFLAFCFIRPLRPPGRGCTSKQLVPASKQNKTRRGRERRERLRRHTTAKTSTYFFMSFLILNLGGASTASGRPSSLSTRTYSSMSVRFKYRIIDRR